MTATHPRLERILNGIALICLAVTLGAVSHKLGAHRTATSNEAGHAEAPIDTRPTDMPLRSHSVDLEQFLLLQKQAAALTVIDTRERDQFEANPLRGARNIPLDELPQRASHEVDRNSKVVLFCPRCDCKGRTKSAAPAACDMAFAILKNAGFADVATLETNIEALQGRR